MSKVELLDRASRRKVLFRAAIFILFFSTLCHHWKTYPSDRIGLCLALICTALSAIILGNEIVVGMRNSRRRITDQSESK
jgi:hypothetical protein